MNYIELHRNSDHTDPRVQARRSALNLQLSLTKAITSIRSLGKTYLRAIVVRQPTVRHVLIYSLSDILAEEMVVKFVLK